MLINFRPFLILALVMASLGLSACETMEGAGRDIQHAGESVENAAD